jgi:hypothetical protein
MPRHQHAAGRVDLDRIRGRRQLRPDPGDLVAYDQDIGAVLDRVGVVHGQDHRVPEYQRPA